MQDNKVTEVTDTPEYIEIQRKKRKRLIILSAVFAVGIVVALILFIFMNLPCIIATHKLQEDSFEAALDLVENVNTQQAQEICEYCELRIDINNKFPVLLTNFDIGVIDGWIKDADRIIESASYLPMPTMELVIEIRSVLLEISGANGEYISLRDDVLSLMEVFDEFNILHGGSRSSGSGFTIENEMDKLAQWENEYNDLEEYCSRRVDTEDIFLLKFMLREASAEIQDLRSAMELLRNEGFPDSELIRYNDDLTRTSASVNNTEGVTLSLDDAEKYEEYLYPSICRNLVSQLAPYYIVKGR